MTVSTTLAAVEAVQLTFSMLTSLSLTAYKYKTDADVLNNTQFDYVVVGCGTGGSILAYRLSENTSVSVLCIEAGTDPQWETQYANLFPYLAKTKMDWNFTSENDNYTAQYHRNQYLDLPCGKTLGGSGSMHHLYYVRGIPYDYDLWAEAAGDDSWSYENISPYFVKFENLQDAQILSSDTASFHGTSGLVGITRQLDNLTSKYLNAFEEVGFPVVDDLNTNLSSAMSNPMFFISSEGIRQSSAESYLAAAKNRDNLYLMKETTVTKVLFDDNLNAIGVQCVRSDGSVLNIYANKEVILAAGALNTPKILMLSGIGPKEHLESLNITALCDSPVGENLKDHLTVVLFGLMEKTNDTVQAQSPSQFPVPSIVGYKTLNVSDSMMSYFTMNLICRNNPDAAMLLCADIFGLNDDVCNAMAAAADNREMMFTVISLGRPDSFGSYLLRSANYDDPPKIYTGFLSNSTDIQNNVLAIKDYIKVFNSTYYKNVNASILQLDLPSCVNSTFGTDEYWANYIFDMMDTTFHQCGTAAFGKVIDSECKVMGVNKLRVGDASAMPNPVSANINGAVMVLAEKCADMIKESNQ